MRSNEEPILSIQALSRGFQGHQVLDALSFSVYPGEVVGLLGPNGAGKTTAFYTVIGLIEKDQGQIFFNNQEIHSLSPPQRARKGIGFLTQEPSIFRDLSVEENLRAVLEFLPLTQQAIKEKIQLSLEDFDLWSHRKRKAGVLSGGQRRRLEIARTLCLDPQLILLDEPFANVDPLTIQGLKEMVGTLKSRGISILITDHNAREIFDLADYCYLLSQGRLLAEGTPEELASNALVKERYLGSQFQWSGDVS